MFDENDRSSHPDDTSRHIRRGARHEDDKTIEVDSSAFFAPEVPQPQSPPPKPPRNNSPSHKAPEPPREHKMTIPGESTPKRGVILLVLQAILSVGALVQLWRTQMLPALYLILITALLVLLWLLVWQAASMALDSDILLVSPLRVIATLLALLPTARFWASLLGSMARILGGFFLAAALGTLLAALAARFKRVEEWLAPPVLAMKTVPVASFVILALIWFGSRNLSVFIALVMVFPVIYTNVLAGVRAADRELAEMARVFRIPLLRRIRCITLPQVAPYFRAGCALGLGLCWKAGVAAEVIGMPVPSIGERLQQAKVYLDTPELFAWTLVIVLISVGFEKLFMAALGALDALHERGRTLTAWLDRRPAALRMALMLLGVLMVVIFGVWGTNYDAQAFIYFQF